MNILLLASHAVAEFDDVRMFHHLGYDVFAPGGYENPAHSGEGIRPALPDVPYHADLAAATQRQREKYGEPGHYIDWGKARLAPEVIEWADVIIGHHFVDRWLGGQWSDIRKKRVIWRTCGQSNPDLERYMTQFVDDGLEVVRYSPAEERYFGNIGSFAGQHALIRFGKFVEDYGPWRGADEPALIGNITQHMQQRGDACGYRFWEAATNGLPTAPAGPGSEVLPGGLGPLDYGYMLEYLRHLRAYLYTGTTPASYTLGLIEAMLSGVPVISIGARAWGGSWGGQDLFEAATTSDLSQPHRFLKPIVAADSTFDDPKEARRALEHLLAFPDKAANISRHQRTRAVEMFGMNTIGEQWRDYLEGVR